VGPPIRELLCRRPPRVRWNRSPLGAGMEGDAWLIRRCRWRGRLADAAGRPDRGFFFAAALPLPGAAARALVAAARHSSARLPHGHAQCCGGSACARLAPRATAGPPQPLHNHRSRAGNVPSISPYLPASLRISPLLPVSPRFSLYLPVSRAGNTLLLASHSVGTAAPRRLFIRRAWKQVSPPLLRARAWSPA